MKRGFSLVELSIVLVILGLLTGGILAGQSLIRASELRAVTTEYNRYIAATHTFRDKYFALPGDMTNAQSFWGVAHATPATCVTTASTTALTCNGDGDGRINSGTGSNELFRFWQHLANAGLIEGTYDGITHGATNNSSTAANSPKSKLGNGYWFISTWGVQAGNGNRYALDYATAIAMGTLVTDSWPWGQLMKPEELWNIDTKLDDGKPAYGKVVAYHWNDCTDATTFSDMDSEYLLTNSSLYCIPIFRQAF